MASRIRLRVSDRTRGSSLMTRETVLGETRARSATSWIVTEVGMSAMRNREDLALNPLFHRVRQRRTRRVRQPRIRRQTDVRNGQPEFAGRFDGERYVNTAQLRPRSPQARHCNDQVIPRA